MEDTFERVTIAKKYADIPLGLYIVRGDNIVLLGQLDLTKTEKETGLTEVSAEEIVTLTTGT